MNYAAEAFFGASLSVLTRQRLDDLIAFGSPIISLVETVALWRAPMTEYRVRVGSSRFDDERAAQLLEQTVSSDEIPLARLIREETDRIVHMIDRVEVFGDERPMERESINIHVILDRVKLLARNGVARGIAFSEEYDPSLPPVFGNRDQLIQIFLNFVKNASESLDRTQKPEIKFSAALRPGIRIAVTGVSERISLPLEITVEDNGPGVPPDHPAIPVWPVCDHQAERIGARSSAGCQDCGRSWRRH